MVKRKPEEHQLESESRGALTRVLSQWVVNETKEDYGIDFEAYPVSPDTQEVIPTSVAIQLKASESFESENQVKHQLDTDSLKFYMELGNPVVLALYEQESEEIYWTIVQSYILDEYDKSVEEWSSQETVQVKADRTPLSESINELREAVVGEEDRIKKRSIAMEFANMLYDVVHRKEMFQALEHGESQRVEIKRRLQREGIDREAAALANTDGGVILIGVSDEGHVVGVEDPDRAVEQIEETLHSDIRPPVDADVSIATVDDEPVVIIRIQKFADLPHAVDGAFYKRTGTTTRPMDPQELAPLFRKNP